MKTLQNVLQKHEINRQKIISSLDKNKEFVEKKLLEEYVEFSYVTILDNITKAQVAFSQNANNLLSIEEKELKQLDNFKTIKKILIEEVEDLEDKIVILDAIAIEKQQYQFDSNNFETESKENLEKLSKEQLLVKKSWNEDFLALEEKILKWKNERENKLTQEAEQRLYEHTLKVSEIKDTHIEQVSELNREQELTSRSIEKDIELKRKELEFNKKIDEESREYLLNYEDNLSEKVSKLIKIKLGFIKYEHESNMDKEKNGFLNKLDILDLKILNIIKNSDEKKEIIKELKEKLEGAKTELNQLTQNTLSVKG